MADWEIALEKQMETWAWLNSADGYDYIETYRRVQTEARPGEGPLVRELHHNLTSTFWNADPIYVTREMMTLLEASWESFEPEVLREEDIFVPYGFVYLPRPIRIVDVRGLHVAHRAIGWEPAKGDDGSSGVFVSTWAELDTQDQYLEVEGPEVLDDMRRFFGSAMVLNYASPMIYGKNIHQMLTTTNDQGTRAIVHKDGADAELERMTTLRLLQFMQALWRMLGQRVAVGLQSRPSRGTRRRLEKAKYPEKYVTVVTLRRPRTPAGVDDERHPVEWSQRWIVSGHWRWQPYGDGTVRQIWISPYVKGPEDKPLVVRGARVFRWAR